MRPGERIKTEPITDHRGRFVGLKNVSKVPIMREHDFAREIANKVLDNPSADPDSDICVLARQLLRADEKIAKLEEGK